MKILVVGGGGREHALIWKIAQNPRAEKIYCAPGNGGISQLAECVDIAATDIEAMVAFAKEKAIDFVVVAPDDPLALGMVDAMEAAGIRAFGPNKAAAIIEASKAYSKELMKKYHIPTAEYEIFSDYNAAKEYVETCKIPVVLKADGLALGKGVLICKTREEARAGLKTIMEDKAFGSAGNTVVIEEFLEGPEVSVLTFCDGTTILPMESAQDHKRALDNDEGTNTGGMGTFCPTPKYTAEMRRRVEEEIIVPTMHALNKEGRKFKGVIFFGLMLTKDGPKLLEYNARFGDPEAQSVLFRMKNDLLTILEAVVDERLNEIQLEWEPGAAVCVVMASGGYPGSYEKGKEITGLEQVDEDVMVFHAGTKLEDGKFRTAGGRVLGVTARGRDMEEAREKAYANVKKIHFDGAHYRTDIGIKK
ncbi:phosphoribosylamine--glycine ligase [Christensenellaceae bacterium NSJ-63]|uniref:Phosphoribosylamine--glycine ligase n=1 Tax=Guopingia tenuis TaxID=2763656 RepID=A0A926HW80_9FIRM|nr:phosphoribosylamine--glycine ligase [Guopingia tenuis]MBC8537411.1 phosphoribosylamine--glycine ligase [Guopingia tenuis]